MLSISFKSYFKEFGDLTSRFQISSDLSSEPFHCMSQIPSGPDLVPEAVTKPQTPFAPPPTFPKPSVPSGPELKAPPTAQDRAKNPAAAPASKVYNPFLAVCVIFYTFMVVMLRHRFSSTTLLGVSCALEFASPCFAVAEGIAYPASVLNHFRCASFTD